MRMKYEDNDRVTLSFVGYPTEKDGVLLREIYAKLLSLDEHQRQGFLELILQNLDQYRYKKIFREPLDKYVESNTDGRRE